MIEVQLNGQVRRIDDGTSVRLLLEQLELTQQRLAVECNGAIVPKSRHEAQILQPGDRIEIVQAIGGG